MLTKPGFCSSDRRACRCPHRGVPCRDGGIAARRAAAPPPWWRRCYLATPARRPGRGRRPARTGVSPLYRSLADTLRALQLARTALAALPAKPAEVRMFNPSPLAAVMADEGRRLAR